MSNRKRTAIGVLNYLVTNDRPGRSVLAIKAAASEQTRRPGRWYESGHQVIESDGDSTWLVWSGDRESQVGDGRTLSQAATDFLILTEVHRLFSVWSATSYVHIRTLFPWPHVALDGPWMAIAQRGGLHSDACIRALALACWGDRDVGVPRTKGKRR